MPAIDTQARTISFKIVYCGTPLSGKTTNLQHIHSRLDAHGRSDLVSLSTSRDRTLFFDFLSVESPAIPGYRTHFHLYTVPGQVTYNATLQLVLRQADGIVFVADSQLDRQRDNIHAFQSLEANLRLTHATPDRIPLVLQYNKHDLPNTAPVEYMEFLLNNRSQPHPSFAANAKTGQNILPTLHTISHRILHQFQQEMQKQMQTAQVQTQPPPPSRPTTSPQSFRQQTRSKSTSRALAHA